MTGFDFGDDLAELTLSKLFLISCFSLLAVPNVRHCYSSFRIGRVYSSFKGDSGLTPNTLLSGACKLCPWSGRLQAAPFRCRSRAQPASVAQERVRRQTRVTFEAQIEATDTEARIVMTDIGHGEKGKQLVRK